MKHVSYAKHVEFTEMPQSVSIEETQNAVYARFRRDIEETQNSDGTTVYTATEFVAECDKSRRVGDRIRSNEDAWFAEERALAAAAMAADARQKRDDLLGKSDKYALLDYPQSAERREEWLAYRQALRDVPEQILFPFDVGWPAMPAYTNE